MNEVTNAVPSKPQTLVREEKFVSVLPPLAGSPIKDPQFVGFYLPEINSRFCRRVFADKQSPDWFKEAIASVTAYSCDDMKFKLRVTGLSIAGKAAYAIPVARSLDDAKRQWDRELALRAEFPQNVDDCQTSTDCSYFIYEYIARKRNMVIVQHDERRQRAIAVTLPGATDFMVMHSANEIWNFTDGITKGVTTLDDEIERYVKIKKM